MKKIQKVALLVAGSAALLTVAAVIDELRFRKALNFLVENVLAQPIPEQPHLRKWYNQLLELHGGEKRREATAQKTAEKRTVAKEEDDPAERRVYHELDLTT